MQFLETPLNVKNILSILLLTCSAVSLSFIWEANIDFNLWDEGFLWYGAQRVLIGEIPIRDFQAYDPMRYYWAAGIMWLLGNDGITSLRVGAALCQVLGLTLALSHISQHRKPSSFDDKLFLVASMIVLMLWMYVYYKVYDIIATLILIAALTSLLKNPTTFRYFVLGACIGLVATIGRNHGIYGLIGCMGALISINTKKTSIGIWKKYLTATFFGIIVGFSPIWVTMLAVDGYMTAFMNSIYYIFELKTTNLSLPVPWPWSVSLLTMQTGPAVHGLFTGICFVAILVFPAFSIPWVIISKIKGKYIDPGFIAVAWLSLPYTHYALSRADVPHLSFAIFPMLIGILLLARSFESKLRWLSIACIIFVSALLMLPLHPAGKCLIVHRCVEVNVANDVIWIPEKKAAEVRLVQSLASKYAPNGALVFATPSWPGVYPLLGLKSPVFDIYPLLKRSESFQKLEIARLMTNKPNLVLMVEENLNGGDSHFFRNTNPLIHTYITENFQQISNIESIHVRAYKN